MTSSLSRSVKKIRPKRSGFVQFRAVFRKEVLHTLRDRRMMFLLIVAPLLQTVLLGFAVDFDVDRVPTVLVDGDRSAESRLHSRRLLADGTLHLCKRVSSPSEARAELDAGRAASAIVLPAEFERNFVTGRPARVQVLLDGTDPNRANVVAAAVGRYFGEVGEEFGRARMSSQGIRAPQIEMEPRVAFNPSLRSPPYMIPGVLGMLLLIVTTVVTAMGMTREREQGTLEQVLVTPLRPVWLLLGKMAPFLAIGLFDVLLVLVAGIAIFDIPLRGEFMALGVATLLYLMSTLGMGLFVSTVSRTQQQSFLGGFLVMMPAILLSGVMTPIASMPGWLAVFTWVNPVRFYVEASRAILLKGAGMADLRVQLSVLLAIGLTLITVSIVRFRKRLQ